MVLMNSIRTLIFPGLDGTTDLLEEFCYTASDGYDPIPIELPNGISSYEDLVELLSDEVDDGVKTLIVAESFSGPLALLLASNYPDAVAGVVLIASFVTPPIGWFTSILPWNFIFGLPMPGWVARRYFLGRRANLELTDQFKVAIRDAPAHILAGRMRQIARIDVSGVLKAVPCPILYVEATRDRLVDEENVNEIRKLRPSVSIAEVDGSHLLLATRPEQVWKAIDEFFQARV